MKEKVKTHWIYISSRGNIHPPAQISRRAKGVTVKKCDDGHRLRADGIVRHLTAVMCVCHHIIHFFGWDSIFFAWVLKKPKNIKLKKFVNWSALGVMPSFSKQREAMWDERKVDCGFGISNKWTLPQKKKSAGETSDCLIQDCAFIKKEKIGHYMYQRSVVTCQYVAFIIFFVSKFSL